jgi:phage terminase large subunit-like protein
MGLRGRDAQRVQPREVAPRKHGGQLSRANKVIRFIEGLKITSGMLAAKGPVPFVLRPWQRKIIRAIYGKRTLRQVLITVPRKNGKTQLAAALALCHLCGPEARHRGQIFSAAADRQQAAIIFREMVAMIRTSDLDGHVTVRIHNKTLEDTLTGSTYEALSSDARKAHGLSPSFCVADELAQWKGRELYDNLVTGCGVHAESLLVVISTKSPDANHVMSELVHHGQNMLDGIIEDETFLPIIFAAPDKADPWGEKVWKELLRLMGEEGIKIELVEWGQGFKDMSPACAAIEEMVLNGKLRHPGHPVLDWCVANAVTVSNPAGGRKLDKERSTGRIDGIVAAAMACGLAARTPAKKPSVYATRGLITLGAT